MYIYKVKTVTETLAFASFHGSSETLHLQSCGNADPCIYAQG